MHNSLRTRLILVFIGLAIGPLLIVGIILAWQSFTSLQQQALILQQEGAKRVSTQVVAFFQELESELRFTAQTQSLEELDQDHQRSALSNLLAYQSAFDELHLLNSQGQEQASVYRVGLASTAPVVDRSHADEFVVPKTTEQVYYGPIHYDQVTNEPLIAISIPLINLRTGSVDGVLVSVARVKKVWDLIAGIQVSPGQSIYIVDSQGKVVAHRDPSVVLRGTSFIVPKQNGIQTGLNGARAVLAFEGISLGQQPFSVVAEQTLTEALAPAFTIVYVTLGLLVLMIALASTLGLLSVRQIVQPIQALAKAAERIGAGDLTSQVNVTSKDEIGTLATVFNSMATQLRELIGSLEQRVADRTKALTTSTEVSRSLSTILNKAQLVHEVVEQVQTSFNYYHAHIYLLDETGNELVMAGGTGEAGRVMLENGHKISKGKGLVGRAAETNAPVLVPETSSDPNWLANPLLPETKSEVAVPISIGNQLLGVLDVQHNVAGGLGQEDADLLYSIASQVAVALQNIRQYENTQKIAADMGVVANVGIATSTITEAGHLLQEVVDLSKKSFNLYHVHIYLVDDTTQTLRLEAGAGEVGKQMIADGWSIPVSHEQSIVANAFRNRQAVITNDVYHDKDSGFLSNSLLPDTRSEMAVPMIVGGNVIGVLDVQSDKANYFTDVDVSIQTTLASQVAIALQNARTLTQTQQQAKRESTLNTIAQQIQSTTTIEEAMQVTVRELGHALGNRQTLVALEPSALGGGKK